MEQDDKDKGPYSVVADWMKSMTECWLSAVQAWVPATSWAPGSSAASDFASRLQEDWQTILRNWQTSASTLGSPLVFESVLKGTSAFPEAVQRMFRSTWNGYFRVYEMWAREAGKTREADRGYIFEGLDTESFKAWVAFYQREVQPLLKMPPVGMSRSYQERTHEVLDKFNRAQMAVGEFLQLFSRPVEESVQAMQEKLKEQAREGKIPENFKDCYNTWIKILEGHYMTLCQSPEYLERLGTTTRVIEEFKAAQDSLLVDMLQAFPVPTHKEMDELYRELYLLKKTVKEMAKKLKKLES